MDGLLLTQDGAILWRWICEETKMYLTCDAQSSFLPICGKFVLFRVVLQAMDLIASNCLYHGRTTVGLRCWVHK